MTDMKRDSNIFRSGRVMFRTSLMDVINPPFIIVKRHPPAPPGQRRANKPQGVRL